MGESGDEHWWDFALLISITPCNTAMLLQSPESRFDHESGLIVKRAFVSKFQASAQTISHGYSRRLSKSAVTCSENFECFSICRGR